MTRRHKDRERDEIVSALMHVSDVDLAALSFDHLCLAIVKLGEEQDRCLAEFRIRPEAEPKA